MIPDWAWVAIVSALVVALVYSWSRGQPRTEPSATGAKSTPPQPKTRSPQPPVAKSKTKSAAPKSAAPKPAAPKPELPKLAAEADEDVDPTRIGPQGKDGVAQVPTKRIVYDEDAAEESPTQSGALILVSATAQTDQGLRRKRNEDALLAMGSAAVYAVADGMGGYEGGEIASALAVKTMCEAFSSGHFAGQPHETLPARASELARAVQMANDAILAFAKQDERLKGMGTTICAARFSPNKQRLYVAHVGDSRLYRYRNGKLKQVTSDHTMADLGVTGPAAAHLSRAVGVWPSVPVDIILGKPEPGDVYMLCSDGLTKMVDDDTIAKTIASGNTPAEIVETLIARANEKGGKDNITVIVIHVGAPTKA